MGVTQKAQFFRSFQNDSDALGRRWKRSIRHQAEPLPGANGLDLLDREAKAASLAAASREQEKPQ